MQFAFSAAAKLDFTFKKQVDPAGKLAFRLAGSFGDRLQLPMLLGQPGDNQARLRQLDFSQKDGGSGVQAA